MKHAPLERPPAIPERSPALLIAASGAAGALYAYLGCEVCWDRHAGRPVYRRLCRAIRGEVVALARAGR